MAIYIGDNKLTDCRYYDKTISGIYIRNQKIWPATYTITYNVDGTEYTEEVEAGANVLNPTTFTASKSGYALRGWSLTSGGSVLTAQTAESDMYLYAVFSLVRAVMLQYYWDTHYDDGNGDGCLNIVIYTSTNYSTGSTYKQSFHEYTGTIRNTTGWYTTAKSYFGIVTCKWSTDKSARFTALTTLYSNSSLTGVGIASGSSKGQSYVEQQWLSWIYYVPNEVIS